MRIAPAALFILGLAAATVAYRTWSFHRAERDRRQLFAHVYDVWPDVRFDADRLSDVLDALSRRTQFPVTADWDRLATVGVTRDTPVRLHLYDVHPDAAFRALPLAMRRKSSPTSYDEPPWWLWTPDGLRFTLRSSVPHHLIVHAYDSPVIPSAPTPRGTQCFGTGLQRSDRNELAGKWIMEWVDLNSWRDVGGQDGSSRCVGDRILVIQTPQNQLHIAKLLASMRQMFAGPVRQPPLRGRDDPLNGP